jgi:hypothetical protein
MRLVVSLLTAVCLIAAAEANTTGVAPPQSQAAPSAPEPSTIDFVRNWQATARPRVSGSAVSSSATPIASNVIILSLPTLRQPKPSLGKPWEGICFRLRLRPDWERDALQVGRSRALTVRPRKSATVLF